ncbi:hypothetical protein ACFY8W_12675 [Streptomyces sp. NPDC012637]|uniref:hypothetical protein n=1 Tax=Streptomyces sp. NPDC012637 TaxID=3364842 RepID=UPI0036EE7211
MAIIDELRTPLYFAAGTADLAVRQAKKVPGLIEQLAAEAPGRIEAVKNTDPKAVQEKAQAKFAELVGGLDTDLKKLGEQAQDLALRGVGVAAEYAVKAREKYEELAAQGEEAVKAWRGEVAEEITEIAVVVEPGSEKEPEAEKAGASTTEDGSEAAAPKPAARKTTARKTSAKKAPATEGADK